MAVPWFFAETLPLSGGCWTLSRDEARHAAGAKRLAPGDSVVLFDGRGEVAEGSLEAERARDGGIPVRVHAHRLAPRPGRLVHLVTAFPKGDRLSTLIDMTAQLGVASVTPLRVARSVVGDSEHRADRARRIQIEACKQARWPWLPLLHTEVVLERMRLPQSAHEAMFFAHPGGEPVVRAAASAPGEATMCIGPEGGFTEEEVRAFRASGAIAVDLGPSILRIETAAVVAVAALR